MRAIIIVMLAVQAAMLLVAAFTILKAKPSAGRPRPIWTSLAIALVITAGASFQIADRHHGQDGADILQYGSGILLGLGLACLLVQLRRRLGTDSAP
ncbi:MAG: hypothetical protein QOJ94_2700 [Sphingomonadales bacterium]|jgi:uncharacterized protein (TIGR03382 family)|nr:hypothetical protein [Sphingomonadales bacterium]